MHGCCYRQPYPSVPNYLCTRASFIYRFSYPWEKIRSKVLVSNRCSSHGAKFKSVGMEFGHYETLDDGRGSFDRAARIMTPRPLRIIKRVNSKYWPYQSLKQRGSGTEGSLDSAPEPPGGDKHISISKKRGRVFNGSMTENNETLALDFTKASGCKGKSVAMWYKGDSLIRIFRPRCQRSW